MSMEMMKKGILTLTGAAALSMAMSATAQVTPANVAGQWEGVFPSPGTYTFSGPSTLRQGGITINCTLSLTGDARYVSSDEVEISVTGGTVMGGGLCGAVNLSGFPWEFVGQSGLPSPDGGVTGSGVAGVDSQADVNALDRVYGEVQGVTVSTFLGSCSGAVDVNFRNGDTNVSDLSVFEFSGPVGSSACSVNGNLTATTDVNAW
ncbi:hypothetical protein [Alloalcanivorax venustensis]|jgi:hypothetical protein|uniref:hypothetical protein n=1 Tax=Alloalcanivorax venustensis TaxID=172371 RepID=UPI003516CE69